MTTPFAALAVNIDGDGGNNTFCLVRDDFTDVNYYCIDGGAKVPLSGGASVVFSGKGGDDDMIVSTAACDCTCGGVAFPIPFVYGAGTVTLDGVEDADHSSAGDGPTTLLGGTGDDLLRGNVGTDLMSGNEGNDTLFDDGGAGDTLSGGSGQDCVSDTSGFTNCNCGDGTSDSATAATGGCNADCENNGGNCTTMACPF